MGIIDLFRSKRKKKEKCNLMKVKIKTIYNEDKRSFYVITTHTDIVNECKIKKYSKKKIEDFERRGILVGKFDGSWGTIFTMQILKNYKENKYPNNLIIYYTSDGETEHKGAEEVIKDLKREIEENKINVALVMELDVHDDKYIGKFGEGVVICKYPSSKELVSPLLTLSKAIGVETNIINPPIEPLFTDAEIIAKEFPTIRVGPSAIDIHSEQELVAMKDIAQTHKLLKAILKTEGGLLKYT